MLESILQSNKSNFEKVEELKKMISEPSFLVIMESPEMFLDEIVPFAIQIFKELPPDSAMTFSQSNDMRVFFMRLLSKFKYKNYSNSFLLELVYELIQTENIFNRYLSLKILFPLLDSGISINYEKHLKCLTSFFRNELPVSDGLDNSRCELGFFAVSEVLNYLNCFQGKYNLPVEYYDEIVCLIASALRVYFTQKLIERFCLSKKVICEFCSMGTNLIKFVSLVNIPTNHFICAMIPDLCYTLVNMSPPDCYYLRRDILETILKIFHTRKDLIYNIDRYFLKNPYLHTDYEPLQVFNLYFLAELIKGCSGNISKIVHFEFDQRIREYLPTKKSLPLLRSCIYALSINLSNALKIPMESAEIRMLANKHIKTAHRIYKLLHLPVSNTKDFNNDFLSPFEHSHKNTTSLYPKDDGEISARFIDYLKVLIKSFSFLQLQNKPLEREQIVILGNLLLFPLTRELPCTDYLYTFCEMHLESLEKIIHCIIDTLLIKHYSQIYSWSALLNVPEINCIFIKAANTLIHHDITHFQFRSLDFYQRILPLAYGFFKIDKKYIKHEFSEYFSVIYDYLLHSNFINTDNDDNSSIHYLSLKDAVGLLNTMFIEVKNCDVAYTGLYFLYNYFEITVKELYNAYTLTFDTFYLEVLFNIPVSLNLLVTKYTVLLNAMSAGLHASKKIKDIIIKYIEYIVEFDSEEGLMDNLLLNIYDILQSSLQSSGNNDMSFSKGINVFSRISNRHREVLTCGTLRGHVPENSENILCSISFGERKKKERKYIEDSQYIKQDIESMLKVLKAKDNSNNIDNSSTNGTKNYSKNNLSIPCNRLRRLNIPLVAGYEFIYEYDIRKNPYQGSLNRILKVYDIDLKSVGPDFIEHIKDFLIDYLLDLLKIEHSNSSFNNRGNVSNTVDDTAVIYQSASDILFSFLLLGERQTNSSVVDFMKWFVLNGPDLLTDSRILYDFIPDGLIYAPNTTFMLLEFMKENIPLSGIILNTVHALVDFMYSKDDLKSNRSVDILNKLIENKLILYAYLENSEGRYLKDNNLIEEKLNDNVSKSFGSGCSKSAFIMDVFYAILFKVRKCTSLKLYELSLKIIQKIGRILLQSGSLALSLFRDTLEKPIRSDYPYLKLLIVEACTFFNFRCPIEQMPEMDKRCTLRILEIDYAGLLKINNLPTVVEHFLKNIDKRDAYSIEKYLNFLFKMKSSRAIFNDLLAPAKKYLPAIAVLEGFSSEDARRKFVENVNKNGNFQSQNPNSFRIFRNLFHKCNVSTAIKTNFIEVYASQTKEHRSIIIDIILNSLEYDLPSFDFLISKLIDLPLLKHDSPVSLTRQGIEIFNVLSTRIFEQPVGIQESLIMYLIEHIHSDFVYQFVDLCIPIGNDITHILTNFLNDFLNNNHSYREQIVFSKAAYNILRYLRRRKCRFNDNKAVLLVYRDLHNVEDDIESLVNWYFKNFTVEDIELLYRINTGFLITSESLLLKLIGVESLSTRSWMIECLRKQNKSLSNTKNTNVNDANTSFLKKCVAVYLRSKGIPVPEIYLQNNFRILEKIPKADFIPDVPRFSPETVFIYAGEKIESSESENSLFLNESTENENVSAIPSKNNTDKNSSINSNNLDDKNSIINDKSTDTIETKPPVNRSIPGHNATFPFNHNVSLSDISFLLPHFSDSFHLIIDLFCDLKIFSKELLEKCKELIHSNVSIRYSALYYLCLFEPSPEYFESVFKLNYQERKYIFPSLQLLVERFGISPFINPIKTVLRSEMRFRTTEYILAPFLCSNPEFLENSEILFEICVFTHRLIRVGHIDRSLIKLILDSKNVSMKFKQELTTLIIIQEIANNKIFTVSRSNINSINIDCICLKNDINNIANINASNTVFTVNINSLNLRLLQETNNVCLLDLLDVALASFSLNSPTWLNDILSFSPFDRFFLSSIFHNNLEHTLSKNVIAWLALPVSTYLKSSLDNQMSIVELFTHFSVNPSTKNMKTQVPFSSIDNLEAQVAFFIDDQLLVAFLENMVKSRYPNTLRFNSVFPSLIRYTPITMCSFVSSNVLDNDFTYPPLFDNLPFVFEVCEPELAISLCMKRPSNIPIDTFESNTLHLFKAVPFSIEILKRQFFTGLLSSNRITRICYLDILFNHTPSDIFNLIQYILLFNYSNIEDPQIEYFICVLLYNILKPSHRSFYHRRFPHHSYCNVYSTVIKNNTIDRHIECSNSDTTNPIDANLIYPLSNVCIDRSYHVTFDSFFLSKHNSTAIEVLLVGLFSNMHQTNLLYLLDIFNTHFECTFRIRLPFIKAFLSVGFSVNDCSLYFNPSSPSLKYYQLNDREMYLGLAKCTSGVREVRKLAEMCCNENINYMDIFQFCMDILKKIESRQASYRMEDVSIIEGEMRRIIQENGISLSSSNAYNPNIYVGVSSNKSSSTAVGRYFYSSLEIPSEFDFIEAKFLKILDTIQSSNIDNKGILEEIKNLIGSFSLILSMPRNTILFSKLLMFCSIASEIIESLIIIKDNLTESIYGRFRMWMIRHPSFFSSLIDWNIFMKWRSFIFARALGIVSENDKRKVSSELCKLNCIYAMKAFKERLYGKACAILNDVTSITTVEMTQNMQRILLDLESLFNLKDYNTMVSLINSLNIAKFSNEEKSRLYFWAYKALKKMGKGSDAEKYGALSHKLFEIIENKKEDLELLREMMKLKTTPQEKSTENLSGNGFFTLLSSTSGPDFEQAYVSKLIEIINEVSVDESRTYVLELLKLPNISLTELGNLSHQKLYYFIPQIEKTVGIEFLLSKNPLLKSSYEAVSIFDKILLSSKNNINSILSNSNICVLDSMRLKVKSVLDGISNLHPVKLDDVKLLIEKVFSSILSSYFGYLTHRFEKDTTSTRGFRQDNSIYRFERDVPLLGEFSILRSKYDNIKLMEYVEGFYSGTFYVRLSNGSLSKIMAHLVNSTFSSSTFSSSMLQFMELFDSCIKNHHLAKLGFKLISIPTAKSNNILYSVHNSIDYSVEYLWMIRLLKDGIPLHSICTEYLTSKQFNPVLNAFCDSVQLWKNTLKRELLTLIPNYNDFYVFKRNFINSYGSIICFFHLLGINYSPYENLYLDASGNSFMPLCINDLFRVSGKFYFRPFLQVIFGSEGINGPLSMFLSEFLKIVNSENVCEMAQFFGVDIRNSLTGCDMTDVNVTSKENTVNVSLILGEMVDPKTGAELPLSEMAWM